MKEKPRKFRWGLIYKAGFIAGKTGKRHTCPKTIKFKDREEFIYSDPANEQEWRKGYEMGKAYYRNGK